MKDGKGGGNLAATRKRAIPGQEELQRTGHQATDSGKPQGKVQVKSRRGPQGRDMPEGRRLLACGRSHG